jgi:hypothetical protein
VPGLGPDFDRRKRRGGVVSPRMADLAIGHEDPTEPVGEFYASKGSLGAAVPLPINGRPLTAVTSARRPEALMSAERTVMPADPEGTGPTQTGVWARRRYASAIGMLIRILPCW